MGEEQRCGRDNRPDCVVDCRGVVDGVGGGSGEEAFVGGEAARAAFLERLGSERRTLGELTSEGYGIRRPDSRKFQKSWAVTRLASEEGRRRVGGRPPEGGK